MSRGGALGKTLQLPPGVAAEVTAVKPSGDCFYDCLHLLLRHPSEERIPASLRSSQAMRDFVAAQMTEDTFELYKMYAMAGVEDFAWLHHHRAPTTLEELQAHARKSGKDAVRARRLLLVLLLLVVVLLLLVVLVLLLLLLVVVVVLLVLLLVVVVVVLQLVVVVLLLLLRLTRSQHHRARGSACGLTSTRCRRWRRRRGWCCSLSTSKPHRFVAGGQGAGGATMTTAGQRYSPHLPHAAMHSEGCGL
jgi:hypothetical protein